MNSTIGIDNLFIQPLVNVILYTVKKIERLVQQEKKSRLLQAVIALIVRGVAHGFCKLNLLCILTYILVLHSLDFLAFFSAPRISSQSVKITRQDPKFFALSTILLSLSAIAIQSIARI